MLICFFTLAIKIELLRNDIMRHSNTRYTRQMGNENYFKIILVASFILMLGGMIVIMIDVGNRSVVDKPEIRINSDSSELLSSDMLQIANVAYAETDFVHTYDTSIKSYETVFVLGAMDVEADHKPATLTLIGPSGEIIYTPPVHLDERGQFKWLLHPPVGGFEIGTNQIVISHPDSEITLQTQFEVTEEVQLASEMSRKL